MSVLPGKWFLILGSVLVLGSCNKESASADTQEVPENTGQVPVDEAAKAEALQLYEDFYLATATTNSDVPWTGDEPSCVAGAIPQATMDKILGRITYYRRAVGLHNQISEEATKSDRAQKAALMMHANGALDHSPPDSWKCYSEDGSQGAQNSLLSMAPSERAIDTYIRDQGPANGPVGHRRWLLWPRLQEIGVGNTDRANAIWVLGNAGTPPEDAPEFIAWPPRGYVPNRLVYPRWSFSIRDADFTSTRVFMEDHNGNALNLSLEALSNAYGDRTIVWVPEGINTNSPDDVSYTVRLEDVEVEGTMESFTYDVILFNPGS